MLNNKDNFVTTSHFKDRLYERFLVKEDQALAWARNFFNQDPELQSDTQDGNQRWKSGSIVVVIDVKRHNYVTAYTVEDTISLDSEVYEAVKSTIDEVVKTREKKFIKQVADVKSGIVTKVTSPDVSIESINESTSNIQALISDFNKFKKNSYRLIENVAVEDVEED